MTTKKEDNLIGAFAMKEEFNELWQVMVNIEAKHADNNTPWRQAESELVVKKTLGLLRKLPTTKYNKDYKKKALKILTQIDGGDSDWFGFNNLRDEIHRIWTMGLPNAGQILLREEFELKNPREDNWDNDRFADCTKLSEFTPDTCPSRGDRNIKKQADIGFTSREHFFYNFIRITGGSKLASRFHTFLHDIYEDRRSVKMPLEDVMDAIKCYEKGKITHEWLIAFTKKNLEESIKDSDFGPWTWNKDTDRHNLMAERGIIYDLRKNRELDISCETRNCQERRPPTVLEMMKLNQGKGIDTWWCEHHIEKKPEDVYG